MSLTRQQAEADVVNGLGADLLSLVGMATTTDGAAAPNADLDGPFYRALAHLGYAAAAPPAVTDADLAQVPAARVVRFLDYAKIMAVDVARLRLAGRPQRQEWDDYKVQYGDPAKVLADLRILLWAEYRRGLFAGTPAVGKLNREHANPLDATRYFPTCGGTIRNIPPDA
jgi:hypothetical protein